MYAGTSAVVPATTTPAIAAAQFSNPEVAQFVGTPSSDHTDLFVKFNAAVQDMTYLQLRRPSDGILAVKKITLISNEGSLYDSPF